MSIEMVSITIAVLVAAAGGLYIRRMQRELYRLRVSEAEGKKLASLGRLVAVVAHELKNPLSYISSSSQILREEIVEGGPDGPDGEGGDCRLELLGQIDEGIGSAQRLADSLLDFSRPSDPNARQRVGLGGILTDTLRFMGSQAPQGVEFLVDLSQELYVIGDRQALRQVFLNLMENAVEAVHGEGRVRVAGGINASGNAIEIVVEDTGAGMPEDIVQRIFEPFFTDRRDDRGGRGHGLGLYIVHEIIREHGGRVRVESEPGLGTRFIIELPAA